MADSQTDCEVWMESKETQPLADCLGVWARQKIVLIAHTVSTFYQAAKIPQYALVAVVCVGRHTTVRHTLQIFLSY